MSVRRWCVAGSVLALSAGLALQPVGASARAGTVELAIVGASDQWGYSAAAGQSCPSTAPTGTRPDADLPVNGGWRTVRMDRTGGSVATTKVSGTTQATARVTSNSRGVTRLDVRTQATAQGTPTSASAACSIRYSAGGGGAVQVGIVRRSWVLARSSATGRGEFGGQVVLAATDGDYFVETTPGKGFTRLVSPRSYQLSGTLDARVAVPSGSTTARSTSASMTASFSIFPIGTRRTLTGTGRPYVVAGHRDCARSRVAVALTRAARTKVRSIAFFVDGQRRVVLRGRGLQRTSLLLTRLAPRRFGVVRADVVLRSGAKRVMKSTSWPCA